MHSEINLEPQANCELLGWRCQVIYQSRLATEMWTATETDKPTAQTHYK